MSPDESLQARLEQHEENLRRLEARLARIEAYLQLRPLPAPGSPEGAAGASTGMTSETQETGLEFTIGEFWLARVGMVALLLGTAFFISYPFSLLPPLLHSLIGFLAVAGLLGLSHFWRGTYPYISRILFGGGLLLLYYASLRLRFFSPSPLLHSTGVALALLTIVVAIHFHAAARRRSELLAGIGVVLGCYTALVADTTMFTLPGLAIMAALSAVLLARYHYEKAGLAGLVLVYAAHLLWLLGNPLMGHPPSAVAEHQNNLAFLFFYATVFAAAGLFRGPAVAVEATKMLLPLLNGLGFYIVAALVGLTFFKAQLDTLNFGIALFFLGAAIAHWLARESRYSTAFYACLGYLALSAGIFARFQAPDYFIWLGWQSLLVISTAIWFRSRIVVVANAVIYLAIFLAYLISSPSHHAVNLSYAVVAMLSARLLNWKTERLALQTELMRNLYLASAFVIVPYGLHHAVPPGYVSLSWLGAAGFYFLLSALLRNRKYRWMAILTILLAVVRVFIIDLARLEAGYRIISFLALGLALLAVSVLYTRSHRRAAPAGRKDTDVQNGTGN